MSKDKEKKKDKAKSKKKDKEKQSKKKAKSKDKQKSKNSEARQVTAETSLSQELPREEPIKASNTDNPIAIASEAIAADKENIEPRTAPKPRRAPIVNSRGNEGDKSRPTAEEPEKEAASDKQPASRFDSSSIEKDAATETSTSLNSAARTPTGPITDTVGSSASDENASHPTWKAVSRPGRFYVVAACIVALLIAGVYIYMGFQSEQQLSYSVTDDSNVVILESTDNGATAVKTSGTISVEPGEEDKMVAFAIPPNKNDAVVRVSFSAQVISHESTASNTIYRFIDSSTLVEPDSNNNIVVGDSGLTLHFASDWEENWLFRSTGSGGFFYYIGNEAVLKAGTKTPYLLVGVSYDADSNESVEVLVNAESLQTSPKAAQSAWGVKLL